MTGQADKAKRFLALHRGQGTYGFLAGARAGRDAVQAAFSR